MQIDEREFDSAFLAALESRAEPINAAWIAYQVMIARQTTIHVEGEPLQAGDGTLATQTTLVIRCSPDNLQALDDANVKAEIERVWQQCFPLPGETYTILDVHPYYLINPDSLMDHILKRGLDY